VELGESVRFYYNDPNVVSVTVGKQIYEQSEAEINGRYIELSKDRIDEELRTNWNKSWLSGRLFMELKNKAYGRTGILVRFEENDDGDPIYSEYTIAEHYSFIYSNDFEDLGNGIACYSVSGSSVTPFDVDDYVRVKRYNDPIPASGGGGCGGNVSTTSILLASLAGALAILIAFAKKRRKLGGKE
jgi:hypothetical protein